MGTEDVKVKAMNMYKDKEGLRFYKRWPCSTLYVLHGQYLFGQSFSLSLCGPISTSRANAHMVHMGYKTSTSHYTLISSVFYALPWNL